eukprot:CAMPEP_0185198096 /NCGR_PEP_ID=MMETSP1140-20130426/42059_1 /TAXON_ID=298111 /ORGANISM="Pavlova sp., Strain CCMP459" /LENGTH=102 /DNA_ID=CAMNT_0027765269 /DNA_START=93 /DNA_END=403 /DNA_ORIENTATION=-
MISAHRSPRIKAPTTQRAPAVRNDLTGAADWPPQVPMSRTRVLTAEMRAIGPAAHEDARCALALVARHQPGNVAAASHVRFGAAARHRGALVHHHLKHGLAL